MPAPEYTVIHVSLGLVTRLVLNLLGQELLEGVEDASVGDDYGGVHLHLLPTLKHRHT